MSVRSLSQTRIYKPEPENENKLWSMDENRPTRSSSCSRRANEYVLMLARSLINRINACKKSRKYMWKVEYLNLENLGDFKLDSSRFCQSRDQSAQSTRNWVSSKEILDLWHFLYYFCYSCSKCLASTLYFSLI